MRLRVSGGDGDGDGEGDDERRLQQISPVVITLVASVYASRATAAQRLQLNSPDIAIISHQLENGRLQWTIKSSECDEAAICAAVEQICEEAGLSVSRDRWRAAAPLRRRF